MSTELLGTVVYLPCLDLQDRSLVGSWELVPTSELVGDDLAHRDLAPLCDGLAKLYGAESGAWANPANGVGAEFALVEMERLHRAVVVGVLADKPVRFTDFFEALDEERSDAGENDGWLTHTSEQARVWGHPLHRDGPVADQRGGMVTMTTGGYNVLDSDSLRFGKPHALHAGMLRRGLDAEYASAVYALLAAGTDEARRLGRSIDWLDPAWQNADAINEDLRIASLHAGFEALLGRPANTDDARTELSKLLDHPEVPRSQRSGWKSR